MADNPFENTTYDIEKLASAYNEIIDTCHVIDDLIKVASHNDDFELESDLISTQNSLYHLALHALKAKTNKVLNKCVLSSL